ncbi:MAG: FAA hydrolase family protein [Chloroflexi bacterium]|nr:FAA hydrolase family protein [Chloroflexota bacterium]
MKLLHFDDFRLGVLKGDNVVDVTDIVDEIPHGSPGDRFSSLVARFDEYRPKIQAAVNQRPGVPLSSVKIRPPVPHPSTIDCMAVNYLEGRTEPSPVNAFHKTPAAIVGEGDTMVLPDVPATIFEGEAELALVIGKYASNVKAEDAMSYVFGYMNFIDGSARGLTPPDFYRQKSRDTFAPIGPFVVTPDELGDPQNLQVKLWNNGVLMQDYNTDDMGNKIPRCIEFLTSLHALEPGDIIALGTSHGGLNPFMDGDVIEIETEGLGRLRINVKDDLERTWARETRHQRQEKGFNTPTPQVSGKYTPKPE